jgi:hypothetical protein
VCGTNKLKNLKDLPRKDLEEARQDINDEVSYMKSKWSKQAERSPKERLRGSNARYQ